MSNCKFSVIVITFNQEKYISQTLDSIISQKHNYSYEIVIGDDCSSDDTRKIIKEYSIKYPDIIKPIFNEKNLGVIKNFYNVYNNCNGEYIMECAGDDYWLPEKVSTQIELLDNNKDVGMCYGIAKKWLENSQKYEETCFGNLDGQFFEKLIITNYIPALSVCYRKELSDKYLQDINPLEKHWLMEDYPMWLWFSKNSKINFINKPLAVYRVIDDSISHSVNPEKLLRFYKNTFELQTFFSEKYNFDDCYKIILNQNELYLNYCFTNKNIKCFQIELRTFRKLLKSKKLKFKSFCVSHNFTFKLLKLYSKIKCKLK